MADHHWVHATPAIDFHALHVLGWLQAGDRFLFFGTTPRLPAGVALRIDVTDFDNLTVTPSNDAWMAIGATAHIKLRFSGCRFGGQRCLALCCRCRRSVRHLHVLDAAVGCRRCLDLRYATQYVPASSRALVRAQCRRLQLGGSADMSAPFPPRPRHMRAARYADLQRRDVADTDAWATWALDRLVG